MNAFCGFLAFAAVACGHHAHEPGTGSGSNGSAAGPWKLWGFVTAPEHQVAVAVRGHEVAIITEDAKLFRVGEATEPDDMTIVGGAGTVVLRDGGRLDAVKAATGGMLWTKTLAPRVWQSAGGPGSISIASDAGAVVLDFATGRSVYTSSAPATRTFYHANAGVVFGNNAEVWLVGDDGKERWRTKVDRLAGSHWAITPRSLYITREDRSYEELTFANGATASTGTCEGSPEVRQAPDASNRAPCAGSPTLAPHETAYDVGRLLDDSTYYIVSHGARSYTLIARDPVGRVRASSPWPVAQPLTVKPARFDSEADTVAVLAKTGPDAVTLVGIDDRDGRVLYQQPLDPGERLEGSASTCWVIRGPKTVHCIDAHSGATKWTVPVTGRTTAAWPLRDGEALVADGNPLTLSRIALDGRRVWQVDLPDSELEVNEGTGVATLTRGQGRWAFSDVLGIVDTGNHLICIDLSTGKIREVPQ